MGDSVQRKIYTETDFENWAGDDRVELIDGQILLMAPPSTIHQRISAFLSNEIDNYLRAQNGPKPCLFYNSGKALKFTIYSNKGDSQQ